MHTREEIIGLLRKGSPHLAAEFGVSKIGLFGSYAEGRAGESSDVDVVVELERPLGLKFVELADYLEGLLGRKVDVLTTAGVRNIRVPRVAERIAGSIVYV